MNTRLRGIAGKAAALAAALLGLVSPLEAAPTAQEKEFFEKKIQPIFLNHCYKCHSEAGARGGGKIKGGLRLDTREGLLKGGDTGPTVAPGKPDASLLVKAVRYADADLQMPPGDRKLSAAQIADIEEWVRMGAPDPRTGPATQYDLFALEKANAAKHWAFAPIFPPEPPAVADTNGWAQSPIDQYILAEMRKQSAEPPKNADKGMEEAKRQGIEPSKKADKVTLIRRASFDLTGLPPSLAEVDAFVADASPGAFTNLVNRLLDSPRYGERWGRYWLDLARYADTKGSGMDDRYVGSHTYRDYVINAFNEDLPYDKFILQQIAADRIPGEEKKNFAALGFLTLGNRFNNSADDIIADRIDVVCKSMLALTVSCARCHDHKFDPIPITDYYALHGIFNSCREPEGGMLIEGGETNKNTAAFQAELKERTKKLEDFKKEARVKLRHDMVATGGDYLLAQAEADRTPNGNGRNNGPTVRRFNRRWADAWASAVRKAKETHDRVLAPWVDLSAFPDNEWAARATGIIAEYRGAGETGKTINAAVARTLSPAPTSLRQLAARYTKLFEEVANLSFPPAKAGAAGAETPKPLRDEGLEEIRQMFTEGKSALALSDGLVEEVFNRDNSISNRIRDLQKAITDLEANHLGAPVKAMVLLDKDQASDSQVKGYAGGQTTPRRFLEILGGENRPVFRDGSGRLELAKAIASEDNPLTARVMVNRIWLGHFGEGIVRTPNDFGIHADKPTHPELLDYLAWTFMEDGWSIKKMHRRIMFTSAYQQSADDKPRNALIDPGNKLLWRMNRRRLDFEALRDTILFLGGKMDTTMGGPPVKLDAAPFSERRSVYGFVDRGKLSGMQRAFDFANPDLCVGKRDVTTVPQQALFLMNNPLVVEQARNLTLRADFAALGKPEDRVRLLYRLIYQRQPTETEMRLSVKYLEIEPRMPKTGVVGDSPWEFGLGQFDPASKRVVSFAAMGLVNGAYRGGGGATLSKEGGHACAFPQTAVIRRWNATRDGKATVEGWVQHSGPGDGVQAMVVSSRAGPVGTLLANNANLPVPVKPFDVKEGDTVDFLVYCRANATGDDFQWRPVISLADAADPTATPKLFDSDGGFTEAKESRYQITAWQKFAQVLLETNELTFYN